MHFIRKSERMNPMKFYIPLLMALIVYTILSFFWGRSGVQAQNELIVIKSELHKNLVELNRINRTLNDELNSLGKDPESIIIKSRNLSYHESDELLLFVNLHDNDFSKIDAGKFLNLHWIEKGEDSLFKALSILMFLISALSVLMIGRIKKSER